MTREAAAQLHKAAAYAWLTANEAEARGAPDANELGDAAQHATTVALAATYSLREMSNAMVAAHNAAAAEHRKEDK